MREDWRGLRARPRGVPGKADLARQRPGTIIATISQPPARMARRMYIKVVGLSDEERHALNTVFRLSGEGLANYALWTPEAPQPPQVLVLDGLSWEAQVEAASPLNRGVRFVWIGDDPPADAWRAFRRPIPWPEVVQAMEAAALPGLPLDLDLGAAEGDDAGLNAAPSLRRALIVSASREARLYLRARLALARLTRADEAASGAEATALARDNPYDVAVVDYRLPDMDAWMLLRALRSGDHPVAHLAMAYAPRTVPAHVRKWLTGTEALLGEPPHPQELRAFLRRV